MPTVFCIIDLSEEGTNMGYTCSYTIEPTIYVEHTSYPKIQTNIPNKCMETQTSHQDCF